ncbi:MAG TPA: SDR family NAD(P)-dependent oxidoreductase [Pyrinomonadaceae bacterium]
MVQHRDAENTGTQSCNVKRSLLSNWNNKVVMITGASSGIGRGVAVELARRGASVGLVARRSDVLDEIVQEIQARNGRALALAADVNDPESMRTTADRLRNELGPIDVLVANAGIGGASDAVDLQPAQVANVINVNILGAVNSVTAVLPEMAKRNSGQLVAISSLAGYRGIPKSAAYCASKAGLSAFFESLRLDLRNSSVDVTIIYPGFIKTPLTAGRESHMPYLMELDDAVLKIVDAIEKRKKSYAFPWQLASLVRLGMIMPIWMYDRIAARKSFRT